jgi:SAM-dependent methyltransferase
VAPISKHAHHRPELEEMLVMLEQWFASERGIQLLGRQKALVDEVLHQCFGYHLLQLSVVSQAILFKESRVQRNHRCHPSAKMVSAQCHFEQLPFANESLDVVILHHVQEFVADPHQILREAQRVIVPNGQLIVLGFNPWSILGSYSKLARFFPQSKWHNHLISCSRMQDWLDVLGFQTRHAYYGCHSPQLLELRKKPSWEPLLRSWPLGNFYMISAIKQVATLTPVRPQWKKTNGFVGLAPVKSRVSPSQSVSHTNKEDVA